MGQPEPMSRPGGIRDSKMLFAILVVTILIVSMLSVFFYIQSVDYRNSKFKTQCASIEEISPLLLHIQDDINDMMDYWTLDMYERRTAASLARAHAASVSSLCEVVGVAYAVDDQRSVVFSSLSSAFSDLSDTLLLCYYAMESPLRNLSYEMTLSLGQTLNILPSMYSIMYYALDQSIDWMEDPYQVVSRMDLDELGELAESLADAQWLLV